MTSLAPLRRFARFEYGEALAGDVRQEGDVPVMSSGGVTGAHNQANAPGPTIVVGRKGSHGSIWWTDRAPFVIDTAYFVVPNPLAADLRWLYYALQTLHLPAISSDVGVPGLSRESAYAQLLPVVSVPEQRRIADFLDERVALIDQIIAARKQQMVAIEAAYSRAAYSAVAGTHIADRRASELAWLSTVPTSWPVMTVGSQFTVDLGKMLDESRQTGESRIPYLRNTNVQWDEVDTSDLKEMDIALAERERFTVRSGDLLICEGGQPGRAALWAGSVAPLGYQKALHRARSRGRSRPEWLLECLRVAASLNVFAVANGQATISHLTNEQLRSTKFPFPDPQEQSVLVARLESDRHSARSANDGLVRAVSLLQEYKQSLITAAVTGEFDVTTASTRIPGES